MSIALENRREGAAAQSDPLVDFPSRFEPAIPGGLLPSRACFRFAGQGYCCHNQTGAVNDAEAVLRPWTRRARRFFARVSRAS